MNWIRGLFAAQSGFTHGFVLLKKLKKRPFMNLRGERQFIVTLISIDDETRSVDGDLNLLEPSSSSLAIHRELIQ